MLLALVLTAVASLQVNVASDDSYYFGEEFNSSVTKPPKRGLALKSDSICPDLRLFAKLKPWFYGWGAEPSAPDYNLSCSKEYDSGFIPMTWSKKAVDGMIYPGADALLGFNEPNHKEQSNLDPADAAAEWPAFEAKAKALGIRRLGSPAAAACGNSSKCIGNTDDWFDKFFSACSGCQVDFIATHTYVCSASALESFLSGIHMKYNKTIWLTEFNCGDGSKNASAAKHLAYMKEALPLLESLDYVERYSWMSTQNTKVPGCALVSPDGQLTTLGEYYQYHPLVNTTSNITPAQVLHQGRHQHQHQDPRRSGKRRQELPARAKLF
jgi:hypothetical protein